MPELLEQPSVRRNLTEHWITESGHRFGPPERYALMDEVDLATPYGLQHSGLNAHAFAMPQVRLQGNPPQWAVRVAEQVNSLFCLSPGWGGRYSRPLQTAVVVAAFTLLRQAMPDHAPAPTVIPSTDGGLQLEWHQHGINLEVLFMSPHEIEVSFEDLRHPDRNWDEELGADKHLLSDALEDLTNRSVVAV